MNLFEKGKKSLIALSKVASLATLLNAGPAKSINPEAYTDLPPYDASLQLRRDSMPGRDAHESLVLSVFQNNKWKTRAINGSEFNVFNKEILKVKDALTDNDSFNTLYVMQHNHSSSVIVKGILFLSSIYKFPKIELTDTKKLLLGPSLFDCSKIRYLENDSTYPRVMKAVNVVVEPGGSWVCGGKSNLYLRKMYEERPEINDSLERLRFQVFQASQSNNDEELMHVIAIFEKEFEKLIGLKIRYVHPLVKKEDFYKILKEFE